MLSVGIRKSRLVSRVLNWSVQLSPDLAFGDNLVQKLAGLRVRPGQGYGGQRPAGEKKAHDLAPGKVLEAPFLGWRIGWLGLNAIDSHSTRLGRAL